jgi:hypothetical protein
MKDHVQQWKTPQGHDEMGVLARRHGVLFVRRDDRGQLRPPAAPYGLF